MLARLILAAVLATGWYAPLPGPQPRTCPSNEPALLAGVFASVLACALVRVGLRSCTHRDAAARA
jgi:hypothetical protein